MGSKAGQKLVVVRKTEKLGERERKALFPSEGKGHDDDDDGNHEQYSKSSILTKTEHKRQNIKTL